MATPITSIDPPLEAPLPREILSLLYSSMLKARILSKRWRKAQRMSEAILSATLQNTEPGDLLVSAGPHPILQVLSGTSITDADSNKDDTRVVVAADDAAAGIATGLALSLRRAQSQSIVVAILPARVTRGSAWDHATQFAAEHRLPIVFVADGTEGKPVRKHECVDLSHWPFPTIAVDGRDVIAVYRVTKEATSAARRGHGPSLVDGVNFLAPGNRGKDQRDPLISFRGYLKRHNAWSDEWYKGLAAKLEQEIASE
jgi:hypothetical protein